jgi:ribosome-associated toxin RatA of RatAB toxin-antitoxin module
MLLLQQQGISSVRFSVKSGAVVWVLAAPFSMLFTGAAQGLSADQLKKLKSGEALVSVEEDSGEADGHIEAVIEIAAAPHRVWQVMTDCARAPRFVTGLKSCRVVEQDQRGAWDVREHRSKYLSMLPETVSVFRSDYALDKDIRFERVSGSLRFLKGSWHLESLDGGASTRLSYSVRVGISAPVPGFMIRSALESDVPKLMKALREEVVTGKP